MSERKVSFGRIFWPSLWAALIVSIIGLLIWLLVISSFVGGLDSSKGISLEDKTVLHMKLNGKIGEKSKSKFNPSSFQLDITLGLADILHGLEEAKKDDKIKGVFIEIDALSCGFATAKEIRDAINDFEESGKFVVAYNSGEMISHLEYFIASAANENYGFPSSTMQFLGLGAELSFFKNTLDNLEVEMQVIRGSNNDFKSAVEPFFRSNMSDSSRLQIETYLGGLWADYRKDIAKDRKVSVDELNNIAENALVQDVTDAVEYKLIDAVKYRDEVITIVRKKAETAKEDDLELLEFSKYAKKRFYQNQVLNEADEPNIAVIIAEGGVAKSGDGLTSDEICKLFQDARENESIKTVVFRINSPGGSALASDEIWREVKLTNDVKEVTVSMGDVAASGGYYIAAPATTIFAEPTTITGSIGVFGVIPYTGKMMENKLGLTFDRASTNKHSIMTTNRKLNEEEMTMIQAGVDEIYDLFKSRVAEGRGMTKEQVDVIARGRVWTGRDAKRIGLVDELGGLKDAIAFAAKKASITDVKTLYYPMVKEDKLGEILAQFEEGSDVESSIELPESLMEYYSQLKKLESIQGMQMRMPYEVSIK
ncbi:MAG TPA: signal peptide peptidase SppA [Crocinitomicaceae bacterium]|nr:signal peptide peptidase SppA [Crocinitomicaceae bacterium]